MANLSTPCKCLTKECTEAPNQLEKFLTVNKLSDVSLAEACIVCYVAILKDKLKRLHDDLNKLDHNQEVAYHLHGLPHLLDEFTQFLHLEGNLKQKLKSSSKL